MIEFTVLGRAQPAGSKKAFALKRGGQYTGRVAVADANPNARAWKQEVAGEARRVMFGNALLDCAVRLQVTFWVKRPQGHFGAKGLRHSAPSFPTTRPDLTKLVRGLEDALTGVVWRDDSICVEHWLQKRYGEPERLEVRIMQLDPILADPAFDKPMQGELVPTSHGSAAVIIPRPF